MNLEQLQTKLLAAARANPPGDRVPYAFSKRILARLKDQPALDLSALWARALWRAAAPCVALAVVISALTIVGGNNVSTSGSATVETEDLTQHFEATMLAALDETGEDVW